MHHRIQRLACVIAVGLGAVGAGSVAAAGPAGATGTTAAPFTITVNGAAATSATASPVSTLAAVGLPLDATGTVQFSSGATVLCVATLPTTTCVTGALTVGAYPGVIGAYSGDATYAGGNSTNAVDLTVAKLVCKKIFGYLTSTVTVAKCGVAQKGAHYAGTNLLTGGTLTWAATKATTSYGGVSTSPGQGACGTGRVEYDFAGTATADTSGYVAVGDPVAYRVCINSTNQVVKLVNGTAGTF